MAGRGPSLIKSQKDVHALKPNGAWQLSLSQGRGTWTCHITQHGHDKGLANRIVPTLHEALCTCTLCRFQIMQALPTLSYMQSIHIHTCVGCVIEPPLGCLDRTTQSRLACTMQGLAWLLSLRHHMHSLPRPVSCGGLEGAARPLVSPPEAVHGVQRV